MLRASYGLARQLGMTVEELRRRMTWEEFMTWILFAVDESTRTQGKPEMSPAQMLMMIKGINRQLGGREASA